MCSCSSSMATKCVTNFAITTIVFTLSVGQFGRSVGWLVLLRNFSVFKLEGLRVGAGLDDFSPAGASAIRATHLRPQVVDRPDWSRRLQWNCILEWPTQSWRCTCCCGLLIRLLIDSFVDLRHCLAVASAAASIHSTRLGARG